MAQRYFFPKAILFLLGLFLCTVAPLGTYAYAQSCETSYEVVLKLREPRIGSYNVWDANYGGPLGDEKFVGGVTLESGNVVLAGEVSGLFQGRDGKTNTGKQRLLLTMLDRRGRVLWDRALDIENLLAVRHMQKIGAQFIIAADVGGTRSRGAIWIGMFDQEGELLKHTKLDHKEMSLSAAAMITAHDGKSLMLAVSATDISGKVPDYGLVYNVSASGKVLGSRAYRPGPASNIKGLSLGANGGYIATGWMANEQGGQNGWIMGLGPQTTILWQKEIPRGRFAHVHDAAPVKNAYGRDQIMALGEVSTAGGEQKAAWLFMIDTLNKELVWQRYFTDVHKLSGRAIMAHGDNQYSVMLDSDGKQSAQYDEFVRLLSVNERGTILGAQNYFQGRGAHGLALFEGFNRERMIAGYSNAEYIDEMASVAPDEDPKKIKSHDGWVIAAPRPNSYNDPCRR